VVAAEAAGGRRRATAGRLHGGGHGRHGKARAAVRGPAAPTEGPAMESARQAASSQVPPSVMSSTRSCFDKHVLRICVRLQVQFFLFLFVCFVLRRVQVQYANMHAMEHVLGYFCVFRICNGVGHICNGVQFLQPIRS
jgi:hypothetical protein